MFVTLLAIMIWLIVAQVIVVFATGKWRQNGVGYLVMNIIIMVYTTLFALFVSSLLVMHLYLTGNNMTTYEMCKKHWEIVSGNPFRKSVFIKNFIKMFGTGTDNPQHADPFDRLEQRGYSSDPNCYTNTHILVNNNPQLPPH